MIFFIGSDSHYTFMLLLLQEKNLTFVLFIHLVEYYLFDFC